MSAATATPYLTLGQAAARLGAQAAWQVCACSTAHSCPSLPASAATAW